MKRTEELALIRAVLEIGRKVSHLAVDDSRPPGLHWNKLGQNDEHELLNAIVPLRQILDREPRRRRAAR
jgi:hypothetical protein